MKHKGKKHYAVIGDPVQHSLSPVMHNAGFKALSIDAEYTAIKVEADKLAEFTKYARSNLEGFNITVPHKRNIIPFLDEISEECTLSQSVNTVSVIDGKLIGASTDGYGLTMAIKEEFDLDLTEKCVCFIGAGGATRAVAFYLARKMTNRIYFINRTISKAEELAHDLRSAYDGLAVKVSSNHNNDLMQEFFETADILVQATSLGLNEHDPAPVPLKLLKPGMRLFDTIYKKTSLLQYGITNGLQVANGRGMLLHQGAKAFSMWTKLSAPINGMRKALYERT